MADGSKIEWTDATWNPIRARHKTTGKVGWHCEHATSGCEFCYSEGFNKRLGTGLPFKPGHRKDIELFVDDKMLLAPLRWKKPRMIFVCSMTDLFADFVPGEWIDKVFAVMALCPQHKFQVLTKRADRMRAYCVDAQAPFRIARAVDWIASRREIGIEEIRPIAGYPGYFASSHGFIYSERRGKRRRMSPDIGEQGHQWVQLYRGTSPKQADRPLVHRIILETFICPAPTPDAQGRHRDGTPSNNSRSNLSWGGQDDNWSDAKRHGTHRRYAKLTSEQAAAIRARHAAGETGEALAREYKVSATQIRNIADGKQWGIEAQIKWPLSNVWKGVSTERQQEADERIPLLLGTPAAVRFVSAEPLLGPIDQTRIVRENERQALVDNALDGFMSNGCGGSFGPKLDWIIVGGESGPHARPLHPDWARSLRDQCARAGLAFFFKQWGEYLPFGQSLPGCGKIHGATAVKLGRMKLHYGGTPQQPPKHAFAERGVEFTSTADGRLTFRVGKKAAGRLLDGNEHNEFPSSHVKVPYPVVGHQQMRGA